MVVRQASQPLWLLVKQMIHDNQNRRKLKFLKQNSILHDFYEKTFAFKIREIQLNLHQQQCPS